MAPNVKVSNAFRAMKEMGFKEDKVKPVLKNLLKLYDKNWEFIEEENYRVLALAIIEEADGVSQMKVPEEERLEPQEQELPLKRSRRGHVAPASPSSNNNNFGAAPLRTPIQEEEERPETSLQQPNFRNKGKQPVISDCPVAQEGTHHLSTPVAVLGKRPVSEGPFHAACSKALTNEPDNTTFSRQNVSDDLTFIKPKDEPLTDNVYSGDVPQSEVPLATISPDPSTNGHFPVENNESGKSIVPPSKGHFPVENDEIGRESIQESLSQCRDIEGRAHDIFTPPGDSTTNGEPATIQEEYSTNLIVASFPLVEDRSINISPTLDAPMKSAVLDALDCNKQQIYMASPSSNGSINAKSHPVMAASLTSKLPIFVNDPEDRINAMNRATGKNHDKNDSKEGDIDDPESTNMSALVVPQHKLTSDELRWLHDRNDLSKGEERVRISWVDEINSNCRPSFHYISRSLVYQNANINLSLSGIRNNGFCPTCFGDCLSTSKPCVCACGIGGEFAYTSGGLVKDVFLEECISMARDPQQNSLIFCKQCPLERLKSDDCMEPCKGHVKRKFIKECWKKCGCNKQCGNRVVQRGISYNLQVFYTSEGKGWGLRTLEDLPKGAFVCEYVGEILTITELYERNIQSTRSGNCTYSVLLDADWGLRGSLKNEEALCLDATNYGNIARFINHRCLDANLVDILVEVENPDHHYYHLAFFTTRKIDALEELTWDYGIDFDDLEHLIKPFHCQCGSKFCRNMKRSNRSRSNLVARGPN